MKNLLVIAAIGIALLAMWKSWDAGGGSTFPVDARVEGDLAPLARRVAALEEREEQRERRANPAVVQPVAVRPVAREPVAAGGEELLERIARLETAVAELRQHQESGPERPQIRVRDADLGGQERAVAVARDANASESARLQALRELRGSRTADGTDARLAVLDDMILLAQTSTEGRTRADVWRQLSGVADPRLRQPLLNALAYDTVDSAREEAAETLAAFLPDPGVEAGLRAAMLNDASQRVRQQAERSLPSGRPTGGKR